MAHKLDHTSCDLYVNELIEYIHKLQEEIDELRAQNKSYEMWMNRSIARIKELRTS